MKKNPYLANFLLILELTAVCLVLLLIRAFSPALILPRVTIPALVLLSVIPLAAEVYLAPLPPRNSIVSVLLAGISFALLPRAAGTDLSLSPWLMFSVSSAVYGIAELLFSALGRRIRSGQQSFLSPAVHAFCLFLVSQCFQGML